MVTFIYTHIPKCAGSTIREAARKKVDKSCFLAPYRAEERAAFSNATPSSLRPIKFFIGHYTYGVHKFFPESEFKYITVLRDPVERIISWYRFLKSNKSNRLHQKIFDKDFSDGIRIILDPKHGILNQIGIYLTGDDGRSFTKDDVVDFALDKYDHIGFVRNIDWTYDYLEKNSLISPGSVDRKNISNFEIPDVSNDDLLYIRNQIERDLYIYEKLLQALSNR